MADRKSLMVWVRIPMDGSQREAKKKVGNFLDRFKAKLQASRGKSSILNYSLTSTTKEKISKFSDQESEILAYKLDVKGPLEHVREKLTCDWDLKFDLRVEPPSRPSGSFLEINGFRLRFGNLVSPSTFVTETNCQATSPLLSLEHASHQVSILLNVSSGGIFFKLCFQYRNVRRLIISTTSHETVLCFHLLNGPSLWKSRLSVGNHRQFDPETELRDAIFQRASSISAPNLALSVLVTEQDKALMVTLPYQKLSSLYKLMQRIQQHGEVYFTRLEVIQKPVRDNKSFVHRLENAIEPEYFEALYAFIGCSAYSEEFRQRLEHSGQLESVVNLVRSNLPEATSRRALKHVFEDILFSLENGDIIDILKTAEFLMRKYTQRPKDIKIIPGTALVRRVVVMPGRVLLRPAELHASNRILRNYETEYALTVSFRDHDFQNLSFSGVDLARDIVFPFISKPFGLIDRDYEMLASSSSQLRDHVVWMYAKDSKGRTADDIRNEMGNFSKISNVAKKMARMGQTLSSTQATIDIADNEYEVVDDVSWPNAVHPVSRKPYCFSDGVGSISSELMMDVATCLGWQADPPSAIQIRFKGCKGMLTLDPRLPGRKMRLRKSMEKFSCPTTSGESPKWPLEVIKRTWPTPLYLNRQFIPLLEHHGIATEILLQLQFSMVFNCAQSLIDQDEALAKLSAYVRRRFPFKSMSKSGWDLLADPFCNNMLYHLFYESLKNVKERARIAVPLDSGRNMLGVMDETGILDYGQVFVQYTSMTPGDESQAHVVQGKVLLSKCPCVHPGDVRVFTAVDVPELRALKDCVVFPSRGKRPHPQEMAGSDLDGDEYIVIWDQKLIFRGPNAEPFVYADVAAREPREFTKSEEAEFFVRYIQNDVIGIASSAHLALSDKLGFNHSKCLNLVEKISAALDFAKTENPIRLMPEEKATEYPDFMANGRMHSYASKKVLGELYRAIKQMIPGEPIRSNARRPSPIEVPGWRKFYEQSLRARNDYESQLTAIMQQHGISTEAELFTGIISKHSRFNSMKYDKENAGIVIAKQCEFLLETTRKRFEDEVEEFIHSALLEDEEEASVAKRQLASAWCISVYGESDDEERNFFSFPWSIASTLAETLRWLKTQPGYARAPIERNMLHGVLQRIFERHSLTSFMEHWLDTDVEASSLNGCSCFFRIVLQYEVEVSACQQSVAEHVLLFVRRVIYGEFEAPRRLCPKQCHHLLRPKRHSVPKISIIMSRLYLRMCVSKDVIIESIPEYEEPFIETTITIRIMNQDLQEMLRLDRTTGFEISINRLKLWTNIDDVRIRLKSGRKRKGTNRRRPAEMVFELSGTSKHVDVVAAVVYDEYFEHAFLKDDQSLLLDSRG